MAHVNVLDAKKKKQTKRFRKVHFLTKKEAVSKVVNATYGAASFSEK